MKARPILFSAPMIRALLAGSKTQTRRIVKPVGNDDGFCLVDNGSGLWPHRSDDGESLFHTVQRGDHEYQDDTPHACPYGKPGDQLWVRERAELTADECDIGCLNIRYMADRVLRDVGTIPGDCPGLVKWINGRWSRPSIHMPRWASRITLEVVSVRVERLQDISYEDALAEGIMDLRSFIEPECQHGETSDECARRLRWPQRCYEQLWEQINGAGSWAANPWAWAVEFRRIEQ